MTVPSDDEARAAAIRSLKRKQGFKTHAVVYALVNLLLIGVWLVGALQSGVWVPWFLFPLLGWGIGLGIQGWAAYGGAELAEADIRREMDRLSGDGPHG